MQKIMNRRALHLYEFGPFRLNATERLLQRDHELVPLTPKVLDTLLILVENAGHVVEKNDLMQQLWPDSFVEESSLTQNVSLLRRALAGEGSNGNYIETIPKRGYRFVAEVREVDEVPPEHSLLAEESHSVEGTAFADFLRANPVKVEQTSSFHVRYLAGGLLVVLTFATVVLYRQYQKQKASAMPKAIAVLPFKTIGAEPEPDVLGLGMADALIIKLSNLKQLTVLPTSSVFRYTSREKDAMAIGHDLGVEGVLDGTVQRDGGRIRVTAQLIRVSDGKTVWSGKFDERYGGLFSLQDSISEQVIASLAAEVDSNRTSTAHLTNDTQAYQDYLTGLYFWNRRTRENLPKAISYLEKAAARDPNFGQAYAILADCYYLTAQDEYELASMKEAIPRADASVNRALELDPNSAEAHTVKAGILLARRMFDEAGTEFRRALELKPTYAVAHLRYGYYLFWSLKLDESLQAMRRAQELDPVSPVTNGALAVMLLNARDYDNSIKFSKRALELEAGATAARLNLAEAYVQKRMFTEALYELDRVSPSHVYALQEKAYALAAAGHSGQALKLLSKPEMNVERVGPFFYARIYGAMGNKEKAFEWLDKIYINRMNVAALKYDAQLDPLRSDERFNEFLRKHNIQYD